MFSLSLFPAAFSVQGDLSRPVAEGGRPAEVQLLGVVLNVDTVNGAAQNFTPNFYARFR